jgi:competence protein ComEC
MLIIFLGLGFSVGWWRGAQFLEQLRPYQTLAHQKLVVQVTAESDGVYGDNTQLSFDGGNVTVLQPTQAKLPGRLKIQGFGERAVYRGDMVRVEGSLYPTRGSRVASISYANLRVLGRSNSSVERLRLKFVAGMMSALPEPQASFGLGLLIGQRTTLPDTVTASLAAVGLTHIIAVSGYNLTIIIRGVRRFRLLLSKYQIAILSLLLMGGFVLVTGFSASIVRASLVSVLSLGAWYYGRTFRPFLLLILVAAATALWSPLYVWSDIGWYLSFLAFFGVLILAPLVLQRVYKDKQPSALVAILAETTAAQVMTAPLILYIFGEVSVVSLVSNLLVVPLVPVAMLLSLIAGLAGTITPAVAGWLALPARVLLTYMLEVARLLANVPHALAHADLPLNIMLALYTCAAAVCLLIWRQTGVKRDTLVPEEDSDIGETTRVRS